MSTSISTDSWENIDIPLAAADEACVVVAIHPQLTLGMPTLMFDGQPLSVDVERTDEDLVVRMFDIPGAATLRVPIKAKRPITVSQAILNVTLGERLLTFPLQLVGRPQFVEGRCRWILDSPIRYGTPTGATLRITNDGAADARDLSTVIPLDGPVSVVSTQGDLGIEAGRIHLFANIDVLEAGKRHDLRLLLRWTDATKTSTRLRALVRQGGEEHEIHLDLTREAVPGAELRLEHLTENVCIGQAITMQVHIENDDVPHDDTICTITGADIERINIPLGPLLPLEQRSFPVMTTLRQARSGTWTVPIVGTLSRNGDIVARAAVETTGQGEAALTATIAAGAEDHTLARTITIRLHNTGLGVAQNTRLHVELPAGVVAVTDSLAIDGRPSLRVDGAVPLDRITLPPIGIDEKREITFRVRAREDAQGIIEASIGWDSGEIAASTDVIHFTDARERLADSLTSGPASNASDKEEERANAVAASASAPPDDDGDATPPDDHAEEEVRDVQIAGEPSGEGANEDHADTPVMPDVPAYQGTFSDAFQILVPEDEEAIELGRLVLGLYEFLPSTIPHADTQLAELRAEASQIVERYIPSVRSGTFGASGYNLSTPALARALGVLRERIGEPPCQNDHDRTIILGVIDLAGASGDIQQDLAALKAFVVNAVGKVTSDEGLGERVTLREVLAL